MYKGLEPSDAFKIMEAVRKKDKQPSEEQIQLMRDHNVPEWYIKSCLKIQYMFPKAHATAYVIMALRIGWFKVHRPIYYYAVYFSVRAKEYDAEIFALGKNAIRNKIQEIEKKIQNHDVTNKEENLLDELKIALEMVLRGYSFKQIDINKSMATDFVIAEDDKSLYLPFVTIPSLGEAVANSIVEARNVRPFSSKKDVERRTAINKTQFAKLTILGVFDELPDDDNNSLF
jgi:DNA polymerase-3 subunit alpha (Gram-positive type)